MKTVTDAETDASGQAVSLPGYTTLNFADIVANQEAIAALAVDGSLRTPDGSAAYLYLSDLVYDNTADTMPDTGTGVVSPQTRRRARSSPTTAAPCSPAGRWRWAWPTSPRPSAPNRSAVR